MQKKYESAVQKSQLDQVINEQQLKISGGLGGNVVTTYSNNEPSETVYGDTNDVKTMLNCMRVNKSGIAFSNNGYSGPYNSAWTIDGKFNADFIQAGHINGNLITGNTIKAGALDKSITDDIANSKEKLINLQDQVDGLIETWSGADKPTLLNYPAVDWNEKEKKNHIGDLYYDANNKCYRFMQNDDGTFTWKLLADTDVTKAIADATKALDATNNSIAVVTTEWYASESPTELYGGTWSEEKPEWNENNYIWSRSKAVTQAGVISYSQPSCVQGNSGSSGDDAILLYIDSSNGTTFKNSDVATIFTVSIYVGGEILDTNAKMKQYFGSQAYLQWYIKRHGEKDFSKISLEDTRLNDGGFIFTLSPKDINFKAVFNCELNI